MIFRTTFIAAAVTLGLAFAAPQAMAQISGNPVKNMLGQASDQALDQLSRPGAFSADSAIRIALPGLGGKGMNELMDLAGKAGMGGDITAAINRAAEQAAAQAKPIFRAAIDQATFSDGVGMLKGGDTGATNYLRQSTGAQIGNQLQPLVRAALQDAGVLQQTAQLSSLGMTEARLTDYVVDKTTDGIFTYLGREETKLRKDPVGSGIKLLKGLKF